MTTELDRGLDKHQVCEMLGLDPKTLYALVKAGEFPAPLQMTHGASRWMLSEVRTFIDSRPRGVRSGLRGQAK